VFKAEIWGYHTPRLLKLNLIVNKYRERKVKRIFCIKVKRS